MNIEANSVLMSDVLQGMIPALDHQIPYQDDSYIVIALDMTYNVITGNLVGISFEEGIIKIDALATTNDVYECVKNHSEKPLTCRGFQLSLGTNDLLYAGPYHVVSVKLVDIDYKNKMCTLGVDLVKDTHI